MTPVVLALASIIGSPEAAIESGHWKQARALVERELRSAPGDARLLWLMSRVKTAFEDLDAAQQFAEKAVAIDSKKSEYHGQLAQVYGRQAQKAAVFRQFGLARKAKKAVETAVALDPRNAGALIFLVGYLTKAPGIIGGDRKRAQEIASGMWSFDPPHAAMAEAILAEEDKQWERVKAAYLKAATSAPESALACINAASLFMRPQFRDDTAAEKYARRAQKLAPHTTVPYGILAQLYARLQRWNDLNAILAEAERNVPDNLSPYFSAAAVLISDKRDPAKAEAYLRKYLAQEPEAQSPTHAVARWRLGLALEQQGKKQEAVREIEAAIRQQPGLDEPKKDLRRLRG